MSKADELWDKHASDTDGVRFLMRQDDFLAALKEYGEHVKAEAVKVCREEGAGLDNEWNRSLGVGNDLKEACEDCAAAIEKMDCF